MSNDKPNTSTHKTFETFIAELRKRADVIEIFNSLVKEVEIAGATREIVYKEDFEFALKEHFGEEE